MTLPKCFACFIKYFSVFMLCFALSYLNRVFVDVGMLITPESMREHHKIVYTYYEKRKAWITSNLGRYMFKYRNTKPPSYQVINYPERGYFNILIWKHWPWLKQRHADGYNNHRQLILIETILTTPNTTRLRCFITEFLWPPPVSIIRSAPSSETGKWVKFNLKDLITVVNLMIHTRFIKIVDPLFGCSVTNCKFFGDDEAFVSSMDAIIVHLHKGELPDFTNRKPHQRWIFWTDESPIHTFSIATKGNLPHLSRLANVFNWSMTYRSDSDIPVPYGRTIPRQYPLLNDITDIELNELVPYWKRKQTDILAAIMMTHCIKFRMEFVMQLQRFFNVDMFGKCALVKEHMNICPGHYAHDCPIISKYLFYIVIENTKCRQYLSEKVFHHAYSKGAIPIIMGAPLVDCIRLLPPNSFIHRDNFPSVKHLAREVNAIRDDKTKLLSYHAWRINFEVVEEHGFLDTRSLALCRVCQGLNYNSNARKVYGIEDIMLYLDPNVCCFRNP